MHRTQLLGVLVLLCAAAAGSPASGSAQASRSTLVHLRWDRPLGSTCIGASALMQKVEELLGRPVFVSEDRAELRIVGEVQRVGAAWVASVRIDTPGADSQGVRRLRQAGDDCAALNPALIVVVSTLIEIAQPDAGRGGPGLRATVGGAGAFGLGVLPDAAPGASLWFGLMPAPAWSAWLEASAWFPVTSLDPDLHGGAYREFQGGLWLCRELRANERLGFGSCAGGQLGAIGGEGRGLDQTRSSWRALGQLGLGPALTWQLFSGFALRVSATGLLALNRPRFFAERPDGSRETLFRPTLLGVQIRAGVVVELP